MRELPRRHHTLDREHDAENHAAGRTIACPTLVLSGEEGVVSHHFDLREIWRRWAPSAALAPLSCGHFLPDEAPNLAARALMGFLDGE